MIHSFVKYLRKWPRLYTLLVDIRSALKPVQIRARFSGSAAWEREWTRRDRGRGNDWGYADLAGSEDEWVAAYWRSREHPHRAYLADAVASIPGVASVLEIGANCGPNLSLLAERLPEARLTGLDINPAAIVYGRQIFAAAGRPDVAFIEASFSNLSKFADQSFDVVLSDATLIYAGPDVIQPVSREIARIARRGIVLLELHVTDVPGERGRLGIRRHHLWCRDYVRLFQPLLPGTEFSVTPVTAEVWPNRPWLDDGAIIQAVMPQ